jgi:acetyl esterase/lipase
LTSAFSRLALFNRLTPKDAGSRVAAQHIAYGPGPRQRLDVYLPARPAQSPAPVVVFFYGGGWRGGDRGRYRWVGRALASRGFIVVIPDYRVVPQHRFPDFMEDGADAVAKAREIAPQYGGDPERIALVGHSAGAYIAVLLALDPRYLNRAGVGMEAIRAAVGLAGPYDFYPFDVQDSIDAFGHVADPRETQPIRFVRADAPPLLLAHGDKDRIVATRHSTTLHDAIQNLGGESEVVVYESRGHVDLVLPLSRPFRRRIPLLDDVTRFLRTHLQENPA